MMGHGRIAVANARTVIALARPVDGISRRTDMLVLFGVLTLTGMSRGAGGAGRHSTRP